MPIPLAIMPPFMAYQSLVMGDAFGRAFQFGKRKISAMSNEEFNQLDIVTMFESISNEYTRMIPTVEKAMAQSVDLQVAIVKELLKIIPALAEGLFGKESSDKATDNLNYLATHLAHGHLPGVAGHPSSETDTPSTNVDTDFLPGEPELHRKLDIEYKKLDDHIETMAGLERALADPSNPLDKNRIKLEIAQLKNIITLRLKNIKDLQVEYKEKTGKFYPHKEHHKYNYL